MAAPTYDATSIGSATATSVTFAHTCTGANRVLYVATLNRNGGAGTVTGVTYNAVALTRILTTQVIGVSDFQVWRLVAPATGAHNIVATLSGSRPTACVAISWADADQTTPEGTGATNAGLLTQSRTITADQLMMTFAAVENSAAPAPPQFVATGTGQTERSEDSQEAEFVAGGTQTGTGTVTAAWTYGGSATGGEERDVYVVPVNGITAASGPTIDTQPVADTGLINGDATRRTTVYTVEASTADGGGITGLDWFEDTDAIADGGIYDIVTTGIGTATASSTLTITRTVKTGTPFSMNARATDANGGTDSDAVNDTWYTGPVLSASSGTTNASGVDTVDITSDYPNADGEFTVVTATAGGVTKQVALHYETPA